MRDGTAWGKLEIVWNGLAIMGLQITDFKAGLLINCRFLVIFLVVSGKKRNFDGKLYKLNNRR